VFSGSLIFSVSPCLRGLFSLPGFPGTPAFNRGPFPPPPLRGFRGTMGLSDTRNGPACPSRVAGWRSHASPVRGFPCCARSPCAGMPPPIPRQDRWGWIARAARRQRTLLDVGLPSIRGGSAPASPVAGPARRSLSLRPVCSPSRPRRPSTPGASAASLPPLPPRLLPGGAIPSSRAGISPAEDRPLFTAHAKVGLDQAETVGPMI